MNFVLPRLKYFAKRIRARMAANRGSASYWTSHMVAHEDWRTAEASLEHYLWRNAQYPGYIELMPVAGADGLVVVDYGCGPGNDLVGFSEFSRPARLIGIDVSPSAITASRNRLALHNKNVELIQIDERDNAIPIDSESVDLVHSSGVLHHARDMEAAILEIHRILKPGGKFQVMVYNYNSLWVHLYTAYVHQIEQGVYSDLSLMDAFRRTTDGPHCPISHCYRPSEFVDFVCRMGFSGGCNGASMSLTEMELLPKRFNAMRDKRLAREHRDFLYALKFNESGYPLVGNVVAGINACYEFIKQ